MIKPRFIINLVLLLIIVCGFIFLSGCKKTANPVKFPKGTFPDTVINMTDLNSIYDDYNLALPQITSVFPIIFSSNRASSGGQFDLEQALVSFVFDKTNGSFVLNTEMSDDPFLTKLINQAETPGNDFGPYRLFSVIDGYEYLLLSSVNGNGNLDFFYLRNQPVYSTTLPPVEGPYPIKLLNTGSDDAYICFNLNIDSVYSGSNKDGKFDIYFQKKPAELDLSSWFNSDYSLSAKVDSINSSADDKFPFIYKNIMVFSSNRVGGIGGFDIYYSIFRNGNWSSPVNLGPGINTSSDEYRPVLGYHQDFTNLFIMFSSNRPGGKGGFDLYFSGIQFPD